MSVHMYLYILNTLKRVYSIRPFIIVTLSASSYDILIFIFLSMLSIFLSLML